MCGAHHPPLPEVVRAHGRRRAPSLDERAFTLVELLVVLIIVGILMAAIVPTLRTTRSTSTAAQINVAGGTVWRAVQAYRLDHHGELPPVAALTAAPTANPAGSTFVDPSSSRYVRRWPSGADGRPIRVVAGTGAPPLSVAPGDSRAGALVYAAAGTPLRTGWLTAYSMRGQLVFRRAINPSVGGTVPLG